MFRRWKGMGYSSARTYPSKRPSIRSRIRANSAVLTYGPSVAVSRCYIGYPHPLPLPSLAKGHLPSETAPEAETRVLHAWLEENLACATTPRSLVEWLVRLVDRFGITCPYTRMLPMASSGLAISTQYPECPCRALHPAFQIR